MQSEFSPNTDWALSDIEDLSSWSLRLADLPESRNLTLLCYDLRQTSLKIAEFQSSRQPAEDPSSEEDQSDVFVTPPGPPVATSSIQVRRSTRTKKASEESEV